MKTDTIFTRGGQSLYETPTLVTFDIESEGLLCQSGEFTLGGGGVYGDGDINDNGEY